METYPYQDHLLHFCKRNFEPVYVEVFRSIKCFCESLIVPIFN